MKYIEPVIEEKVVAKATGRQSRINGTARACRNLTSHNFGGTIDELAANPQANQRDGTGRAYGRPTSSRPLKDRGKGKA